MRLLRDLWFMRWPLGLAAAFGAFAVLLAWICWYAWYFNGH